MDYDMSIHTNPDAMAWIKFFRECNPSCNVPDDVMLGWFANSMMAMRDHLQKCSPINGDHAQYILDQERQIKIKELSEFPFRITMDVEIRTWDGYYKFGQDIKDSIGFMHLNGFNKGSGQITITQTAQDISSAKFRAEELISQYFKVKNVRLWEG